MNKTPLERITITIPQPLLAAADQLAIRLDRSRSWILAEAVRRMVAGENPAPPSPTTGEARTPAPKGPTRAAAQLQQRLTDAIALTPPARLKAAEDRSHPSRLIEIIRALHLTETRFLVTGAAAEILHGLQHPVRRIEILLKRNLENAVRTLAGLESAGYPQVAEWLPEQLLDQAVTVVPGEPGIVLYSALPSFRYDEADQRADQFVIGGVRVPVMSLGDLILARTQGPMADADDLEALQLLRTLTRRANA